ncbi:AraC family transcriptional regulator [Pseudobutyrivibrio sp.]|uniref:AraC family transcriptional regulator n=1 Tax=Pseudobutyrivibrio sp. TaxID=2014367 RepID=UPI001D52B8AA|nr:AraC family transcriptional regulator [Pseudobutyrivibrio sp.]MBE5911466.1 helix-turn-helix domain-containing protein [Pseudobutyrivibrio sp.]
MGKREFLLNEYEIAHKKVFEGNDRGKLYFRPLTVTDIESKNEYYQMEKEIFEKYHIKDESDVYRLKPLHESEEDKYVAMTRIGRYTFPFLHRHDFIEIQYVYHGECRHYINNNLQVLKEGDIWFLGEGTVHANELLHDDDIAFSFMISKELFGVAFFNLLKDDKKLLDSFSNILKSKSSGSYILYRTGDDEWLHNEILSLYEENMCGDSYMNESISLGIHQILIYLMRHYRSEAFEMEAKDDKYEIQFIPLFHYMTDNYQTVTLQSMADDFGYSEIYLSNLIKKSTGKSFIDFITGVRMDLAKDKLLHTAFSITQIAQDVGFYDASHFTNKFKRLYGMTPNEYRKNSKSHILGV